MESAVLEAGSDTAEAEAAAALAEQANAYADAATRAREAAATGMTQAEREATAEHDGAEPPKRRKRAPAQGNLAGGWEELIGGTPDTELKVALVKPAAVQFENQPEKLRKQTVHRILITVKVTGFASDDTLDPETHDVASSTGKRKMRVLSGVFLDPEEYIAQHDEPIADA